MKQLGTKLGFSTEHAFLQQGLAWVGPVLLIKLLDTEFPSAFHSLPMTGNCRPRGLDVLKSCVCISCGRFLGHFCDSSWVLWYILVSAWEGSLLLRAWSRGLKIWKITNVQSGWNLGKTNFWQESMFYLNQVLWRKIVFSGESLHLDHLFAFFSCVEFWQVIFHIIFPHRFEMWK